MELVSIIVPVYNVEKYLPECLDSILASTYTNLEVIVIDDGSPDNCPEICDEYALKDQRIKVIHQKNQGLVGARNTGLAAATGKYVAFVDSDDMVSPVLYQSLVDAIEREAADIAACEYTKEIDSLQNKNSGNCAGNRILNTFDQQLSVLVCAPSIRKITWSNCYVWNKLYRRELINFAFQPECLMCEDLRFNWDYIHNSKKMVIVPAGLYMYRLNDHSIIGTYKIDKNNPKMIIKGVANASIWIHIAENAKVSDSKLKDYLYTRAAYTAHGALWRIFRLEAEHQYSDFVKKARSLLCEHGEKILQDKEDYSFLLRVVVGICRYFFPIWKIAVRISAHI